LTANWLASLPDWERQAFLRNLTKEEREELVYRWPFWARDKQLAPVGDWTLWVVLAGRGFGKTRIGAEWIRREAESGLYEKFALVGQTAADVRDVMVEGESGLLACSPPWFYPRYEPSKRRITWPNGATATTFSGDEPGQLRGPQHHRLWADELAKWKFAQETWDNIEMGLRLGELPRACISTTPRATPIIKALVADEDAVITKGHSDENRHNLAVPYINRVIRKYEGTRLGRQELNAEILDDNPDALWSRANIEANRVRHHPDLVRIVVAVDPQAADKDEQNADEKTAETGIIVAGVTGGALPHAYVLADYSVRASPNVWGGEVLKAYNIHHADRVVAEVNNGGAMVEYVIVSVAKEAGQTLPYTAVHASRGKQTRAEPISALYEQNRVHHVGTLPDLEDQMCEWVPGAKSPDRMDALVWALTALMVTGQRRMAEMA
jgi:phage terminase large subunit-like protein